MSSTDVQTLRDAYAAYKAGDLPAVLAALDEGIEWRSPRVLPQGGAYRGHAGVQAFLKAIAEHWNDVAVQVHDVIERAGHIVVLGRTSGTLGATRVGYDFAHVWEFTAGRATRFTELVDPDELLGATVAAGGPSRA
jgi:uncharacterized protein